MPDYFSSGLRDPFTGSPKPVSEMDSQHVAFKLGSERSFAGKGNFGALTEPDKNTKTEGNNKHQTGNVKILVI